LDQGPLASLIEVPDGEMRAFESASGRVLVAHVGTSVYGLRDECAYGACALSEGTLLEDEPAVECPDDSSVFSLETGEPLDGPALDAVAVVALRVEEGTILVGSGGADR
jgi:nitrite reductase/ring-hydroxylating ferredoxin subunit